MGGKSFGWLYAAYSADQIEIFSSLAPDWVVRQECGSSREVVVASATTAGKGEEKGKSFIRGGKGRDECSPVV